MGQFSYIGTEALTALGRAALKAAVTESAEDLVGKAQAETRVDTGAERAGIHVDSVSGVGSNASLASYTAVVSTGGASSEYDIYQHEGTYKMSGTHFLSGPLIEHRGAYLEAIARAARGAY
jgi:hypothetical protein